MRWRVHTICAASLPGSAKRADSSTTTRDGSLGAVADSDSDQRPYGTADASAPTGPVCGTTLAWLSDRSLTVVSAAVLPAVVASTSFATREARLRTPRSPMASGRRTGLATHRRSRREVAHDAIIGRVPATLEDPRIAQEPRLWRAPLPSLPVLLPVLLPTRRCNRRELVASAGDGLKQTDRRSSLRRRTGFGSVVLGLAAIVVSGSACGGSGPATPATTLGTTAALGTAPDASNRAADGSSAAVTVPPAAAPTIASSPVATAVHASTPSTRPARGLATPEAASKNLWDAWRDDDRPRALVAATSSAVDSLFREVWGAEIHNQGCAALSANTYRCAFADEATARIVTVVGGSALGYRSTRVDIVGSAALVTLVPVATAPVGSVPAGATTLPADGVGTVGSSEAPTIATTARPRRTARTTVRRTTRSTRAAAAGGKSSVPAAATPSAQTATQPVSGDGRVAVNAPVTRVTGGNG